MSSFLYDGPDQPAHLHSLIRTLVIRLTHLCLASLANSVDPDQTPQNAASGQGLHCALTTGISIKHGNDQN